MVECDNLRQRGFSVLRMGIVGEIEVGGGVVGVRRLWSAAVEGWEVLTREGELLKGGVE